MKMNLKTSVAAPLFAGTAAGASQSITQSQTLIAEHDVDDWLDAVRHISVQ